MVVMLLVNGIWNIGIIHLVMLICMIMLLILNLANYGSCGGRQTKLIGIVLGILLLQALFRFASGAVPIPPVGRGLRMARRFR